MGISPAKGFSVHILSGRFFNQRRSRQKNCALPGDNNRLVGHGRHIGPASGTRAHHNRYLRNARCAHPGLIIKNTAKMIPVWKHLVLIRQVGPARIHQIQTGQVILLGYLLGAQMFFYRKRIICPALYRCIVTDNHAPLARYLADPRDQTC